MTNWQSAVYPILLLFTASFAALIAYFALRRRATLGSRTLALLMFAISEWAFANVLEASAMNISTKVLWSQVSYLGIHSIPPLFLILALQYSQQERWLTPRNLALLWVIPVTSISLAATNNWHNLIWADLTWSTVDSTILIYHYGVGFWVGAAYSYLLFFLAISKLVWAAIHLPIIFRPQLVIMILAATIPWVGNLLYITKLNPFPGRDLTPISFLLTGILLTWSIFRHQFLDITPIARSKLVDTMRDVVIVVDSQLRIGDLNPAAQSILNTTSNESVGQPAHKVLGRWPYLESRFRTKLDRPTEAKTIQDNRGNWYEVQIFPLKGRQEQVEGWLIILRDITVQKDLKSALQASEELYRSVTENANDGIAILQETIIKYCNPQLAAMVGSQPEEVRGKPFIEFFPPDQVEVIHERYKRRLRGEEVPSRYETALLHKSGQRVPIEANVSLMTLDGKPATLTIARDISERLKAEVEISRLAAVVTQAEETVVITNLDGDIEYVNPQFEAITGYTVEEALGQNPRVLKSGLQDEAFYKYLWDTITGGKPWEGNFINKRKDGTLYHEAATIFPIKDRAGEITHYAAVKRDITAQVQAEEELKSYARHQKLLNEITLASIETTEFESTLQIMADRLGELIHADGCYITLWDPKEQKTIPRAAYGQLSEQYKQTRFDPNEPTATKAVLQEECSLVIEDVFNSPHISPKMAAQFPARSMLALPLIVDKQKLGAAMIAFNEQHKFTPEEIALGKQASWQIALALYKAHLLETARQRATEAETLRQAGAAVSATLKLDEAIARILEQLNRVVPYDSASVQLLRGEKLEIVGQHGFKDPSAILGVQISLTDDAPNSIVIEQRRPFIVKDAPTAYTEFHKTQHSKIRGWMGVPLIVHDRVMGMLALDSHQPERYTNEHARLASAFAAQVAIALENAHLYEEAHRLAITDPLTCIYNRRHFMHLALQEYQRACRYKRPLSIIMLDIDYFKRVNDTYGHLIGDQVLRAVALTIQDDLRESDFVGRYGGEEFVILLPETPSMHQSDNLPNEDTDENVSAKLVAQRVCDLINNLRVQTEKGVVQITASLGVVGQTMDFANIETLLDHADTALYIAKQRGRN
ncbi:MAG: PAS domain S-box protein, partial [Anaerolineales bacterium]|nr:PAS domain S-box protein [Anaerolineales bacterium]